MSLFVIAFQQILILFLIMVVGYICRRIGVVGPSARKELTAVLMNIVLPCVVLESFLSDDSAEFVSIIPRVVMLLVIIYAVSIALSLIFIKKHTGDYAVERLSAIFSNAGFLGLPLLQALYGALGSFCAIMAVLAFNIVYWTYGAYCMSEKADLRVMIKNLISPSLISVALALLLLVCGLRLPDILMGPIGYLSNMNSSIAMLVTGILLAESDLSKIFGKRVLYTVFLKNIVIPVVIALIFFAIGSLDEVGVSLLTTAACPTGALVSMMAITYDRDTELASGIFTLSTVVSMLTLPAYVYLLSRFIGA